MCVCAFVFNGLVAFVETVSSNTWKLSLVGFLLNLPALLWNMWACERVELSSKSYAKFHKEKQYQGKTKAPAKKERVKN